MRIRQIICPIKVKRDHFCPFFCQRYQKYPPTFPIEIRVQVALVQIIASISQKKIVSLTNFPRTASLPQQALYSFIRDSSPIRIFLKTASNPFAILNEISQRVYIDSAITWIVMRSIRRVMEFDVETILIKLFLRLLFCNKYLLNIRSTNIDDINTCYFGRQLILIPIEVIEKAEKTIVISDCHTISMFMIFKLINYENAIVGTVEYQH